jgi:hypothetical protein
VLGDACLLRTAARLATRARLLLRGIAAEGAPGDGGGGGGGSAGPAALLMTLSMGGAVRCMEGALATIAADGQDEDDAGDADQCGADARASAPTDAAGVDVAAGTGTRWEWDERRQQREQQRQQWARQSEGAERVLGRLFRRLLRLRRSVGLSWWSRVPAQSLLAEQAAAAVDALAGAAQREGAGHAGGSGSGSGSRTGTGTGTGSASGSGPPAAVAALGRALTAVRAELAALGPRAAAEEALAAQAAARTYLTRALGRALRRKRMGNVEEEMALVQVRGSR